MTERLTTDDLLFEVRRALRAGSRRVELRRRMTCPSCSESGAPFDPGPLLLVVEVDWAPGVGRAEQVRRALERCREAAREAGITVADDDPSTSS